MKNSPGNAGISYIEAVVLTGVLGLLAAIAIPYLGKAVNEMKRSRALSDCKVIADAIERFYRDVGYFPTKGSSGAVAPANGEGAVGAVFSLVSGESVVTVDPYGFATDSTNNTRKWLTGGSDDLDYADTLSNHLTANSPKGQKVNMYPTGTSLQYRWKGPYLTNVQHDPWGHPYVVTLVAPAANRVTNIHGDAATYSRWVVCAGPDGVINTVWHPTGLSSERRANMMGDDIGVRLDIELTSD